MELIIEHLQKSFEKKEVLKDINYTFKSGKIYGLLGRNGAGKTTLFKKMIIKDVLQSKILDMYFQHLLFLSF